MEENEVQQHQPKAPDQCPPLLDDERVNHVGIRVRQEVSGGAGAGSLGEDASPRHCYLGQIRLHVHVRPLGRFPPGHHRAGTLSHVAFHPRLPSSITWEHPLHQIGLQLCDPDDCDSNHGHHPYSPEQVAHGHPAHEHHPERHHPKHQSRGQPPREDETAHRKRHGQHGQHPVFEILEVLLFDLQLPRDVGDEHDFREIRRLDGQSDVRNLEPPIRIVDVGAERQGQDQQEQGGPHEHLPRPRKVPEGDPMQGPHRCPAQGQQEQLLAEVDGGPGAFVGQMRNGTVHRHNRNDGQQERHHP